MSYYVFGSSLTYLDYLQARSFERSFKSEISTGTRSIIASNEELQRRHIGAVEAVSRGIEQLSFDVQELTATFQWGFSELLTAVGRVNDALTALVEIARTQEKTWAYEQFEDARNAFRQGLYDDALESVGRAIDGYSGHTGYKLEYRFHYLVGTIRMGSFQNTSKNRVNLGKAEAAFLMAAKYARHDNPKEAGGALLAAGWSAYCQGKMGDAIRHTEQALVLVPDMAEGHFQLAKIQMHVGDPDRGLPSLERAIELDRLYAIKAAGDGDFKRYEAKLQALLDTLRQQARQKSEALFVTTQRQAVEAENCHVQEFSLVQYADLDSAKRALRDASTAARLNTLYGHQDAASFCMQARQNIQNAIAEFAKRADAEVNQRIAELNNRINSIRHADMGGGWAAVAFLGVILFFILGCQQCRSVSEANARQRQIWQDAVSGRDSRVLADMKQKGYDLKHLSVEQEVTIFGHRHLKGKKGYNLRDLSVEQADAILGYRIEDLPPLPPMETGNSAFGAWFSYAVLGSALAVTIAVAGTRSRKTKAIAALEDQTARLEQTRSEIQRAATARGADKQAGAQPTGSVNEYDSELSRIVAQLKRDAARREPKDL